MRNAPDPTLPAPDAPVSTQPVHNQYVISSAYRTLEILRAFSTPPHRFSLAELVAAFALDKGPAYRSLKTLEEAGFLRMGEDGRFLLTPLLNVLSAAASSAHSLSLAEVASPQLSRLAEETGETVHLFALVGGQAVCVGIRESRQSIRLSAALGMSAPLHAGASPKAMLASLPAAEQTRVLGALATYPQYTGRTLRDEAALRAELSAIRARGYAVSDEDVDAGARGVGAPIFGPGGQVVGAISVGGPSYRVDDALLRTFGSLVIRSTQAISRQLGYAS